MTTDALITQKHIAWTVREPNAHYLHLLALKDDHPTLFEDVQNFFDYADKVGLDLQNRIPTNGEVVVLTFDGSVVGLMRHAVL